MVALRSGVGSGRWPPWFLRGRRAERPQGDANANRERQRQAVSHAASLLDGADEGVQLRGT